MLASDVGLFPFYRLKDWSSDSLITSPIFLQLIKSKPKSNSYLFNSKTYALCYT